MGIDSASMDPNLILKTKLHPPPVTPELVPRTHLLDRLERNQHRPLTLISAPTGYGKSVLASMWLQSSGLPFGWISLDEHDNDLAAFFAYLLAAIESAVPEAPLQQSQALLELPTPSPIRIMARILLNDLSQIEEQLFLVLDDIHELRELSIFELLATLLKHPSPSLHFVIIGRRDPPKGVKTPSRRERNKLSRRIMLDIDDLCFKLRAFMKKSMLDMPVDFVIGCWCMMDLRQIFLEDIPRQKRNY